MSDIVGRRHVGTRVTHTIAELEVSTAAFDEIRKKLVEAGYDHQILKSGVDEIFDVIDMYGIGLVRAPS